ncbi:hypothetical protein Poli38472_012594 [Pythium oligandrum]|uniref:FYVE-type domain-containing protein n=1 Tax=Pythium oligandrum TaxID=41045 RepID=A0A8K1CF46_PYTOL|nr:hypothetical protein Poli38472_012594 [Pythium oligandrum]|eukprot:TMW61403.1 hypothetical protein Poli38472_012594 [Pythium oligandrum]
MLPQLQLTPEEEQAVKEEVSGLLGRSLAREAEFRRRGGHISKKEWKQVLVNDSFRIYKQRKVPRPTSDPSDEVNEGGIKAPELLSMRACNAIDKNAWLTSFSDEEEESTTSSGSNNSDDPQVPALMCAGYLEGTLEDAIFGSYDGDETMWRVRTAYMKDKFADARIIATIDSPTYDQPFRFLGIKWFEMANPAILGTFIHRRDTLVIEAMGIAVDDRGERYGYYLLHDFRHPRLPELTELGIVRNSLSMCYISRQVTPDRVGMYAYGHLDVGGDLLKSVGISIAATSIAATANSVETSFSKKLAYLLSQHECQRRVTLDQPALTSSCHSCQRSPSGILSRGLTPCQACRYSFCSKCCVDRKIVYDVSGSEAELHSVPFCFGCVLQAKQLSPIEVARATLIPKPQ